MTRSLPRDRADAEAALDRSEASALADLQMHWDEAYEIGLDGDIWSARFRGSADQLRAHTSQELRELIRTDYSYRDHVGQTQGSDTGNEPDDDDSYDAHYDSAHYNNDIDIDIDDDDDEDQDEAEDVDDEDGSAAQPRANFSGIRGERMST